MDLGSLGFNSKFPIGINTALRWATLAYSSQYSELLWLALNIWQRKWTRLSCEA